MCVVVFVGVCRVVFVVVWVYGGRDGTRLRAVPVVMGCCGGVLLSHNLSVAVPLALPGLASRFGMEAGRFPGAMTTTRMCVQHAPRTVVGGGVG